MPLKGGVKHCVLCNKPNYTLDELAKVERMTGRIVSQDPYFYLDYKSGRNSFKDYIFNEALFFGMIKRILSTGLDFDMFRRMLTSGLYNYYMTHKEAFSDYNFNILNQVDGNNRTWNPFLDDVNSVIEKYIEVVLSTQEIYTDVSHTNIYMSGYDDIEFYRDLEYVEGNINRLVDYPNNRKEILKREIYFRTKVKRSNANELKEYMKDIFRRILNNANRFLNIFEIRIVEVATPN